MVLIGVVWLYGAMLLPNEGRSINKLQNSIILLISKYENSEIYVL